MVRKHIDLRLFHSAAHRMLTRRTAPRALLTALRYMRQAFQRRVLAKCEGITYDGTRQPDAFETTRP
jgi:hypothetical protein